MNVVNKTNRPIAIPLPRGKVLHLGPRKTGQITTEAAKHPALEKLVATGDIELLAPESGAPGRRGSPATGGAWVLGRTSGVGRRGGDR
jgi:hypothetical protein